MKAALKAMFTKEKIQYHAPVWVCLLFIAWLAILPTGYQEIYREAEQCVAKVIQTDESKIIDTGLVRSGEQRCQLEIVSGKFKGRTAEGVNMLNGVRWNRTSCFAKEIARRWWSATMRTKF